MDTQFADSPDGLHIAYDRNGSGPAIVLLHGGGSNRKDWHEAGYVENLRGDFTVITMDLRGHGDSDQPTDPADYTAQKMGRDILSVADACGIEHFTIWGWSFGARVSRYLAARSERVARIVLMGATFGPGVEDEIRGQIEAFCAHWVPIIQAKSNTSLEIDSLSKEDREFMQSFNIPVMMAWGGAMLDWPSIEPADIRCPALWLNGSEDHQAMASAREYEKTLQASNVRLQVVDGLNHEQIFERIDLVLPKMVDFSQSLLR